MTEKKELENRLVAVSQGISEYEKMAIDCIKKMSGDDLINNINISRRLELLTEMIEELRAEQEALLKRLIDIRCEEE